MAKTRQQQIEDAELLAKGLKKCGLCRAVKPMSEFHVRRLAKDGRCGECRQCFNARKKTYVISDAAREKRRQRRRGVAYLEACRARYCRTREHALARDKAYRLAHVHEISVRVRARHEAHPEIRRSRVAKFRAQHPEHVRRGRLNSKHKRRARAGGSDYVSAADYAMIEARDVICYLCGRSNHKRTNSIDHVTPLSAGGVHTITNLKLVHRSCNSSKGSKLYLLPFDVRPVEVHQDA